MSLARLWSLPNLELAWRRLTTGRNIAYKRYFRKLYYAYELGLDANLKDLHARLQGGSFKPRQPTKIYLPKPSGLQRPLTLLAIEDQIALQAIANVFAEKVALRRRKLEHKYVFSNIVQQSCKSIFFLQDWRRSYTNFQAKVMEYYNRGFRWIAHFDLAAYYDTICHDALLRTAFPRTAHQNRERILRYLMTWSSESTSAWHGHGIPQGPIGSDFLAECFLLPVDEALCKRKVRFVRYVDDIRLFAKTENKVRAASLEMEILLRERGLIPQGKKHSITNARTLEDAMGNLPSINPRDDAGPSEASDLSPAEAARKFRSALSGKPLVIAEKTRARYVLFHAEPSRKLLSYVLRLLPRHPEHIDAFVQYLLRHKRSVRIIRLCKELVKTSPYEYVQGEMWHILAQMLRPSEMRPLISRAVDIAKDKKAGLAVKWGALNFLCVAEREGLGKYGKFVTYQKNALLQALLAPVIPDARYAKGDTVDKMLRRSAFEPGIAVAEQLVRLRLNHRNFGIQSSALPSQVRNTFRAFGLIRQSPRHPRVDPIGEILADRYKVPLWDGWKKIMGAKYGHAVQLLSIADAAYDMGRSQWLSYQNSFNHTLFLAFQGWLQASGRPGVIKTVDRNGNAVKFGVMVGPNQPFTRTYPIIASAFSRANARRNTLPASHPYEQSSGRKTSHLRKKEQTQIAQGLAKAYAEIIRIGNTNPQRITRATRRTIP